MAVDIAPSVTVELDRALLAGIALEGGSRTSHAAIIAREFGIPAIVGCEDATKKLAPLQEVTGSCAEGDIASMN